MAQAEVRTNMDTVVVNVTVEPPEYDANDRSPAKFKYIGQNPTGANREDKNRTTTLGYTFVEGEAVTVTNPMHKFKLRGNPHFEEVGAKKDKDAPVSTVDPTAQGDMDPSPSRGLNYETARPPFASVLDVPNPLSPEEQKKAEDADRDAGRKPVEAKKK